MTRREARELAFILLFERSFGDLSVKEILEASAEARDVEADDFALRLAEGAEAHFAELDDLITQTREIGRPRGSHAWRWRLCAWRYMKCSMRRTFP